MKSKLTMMVAAAMACAAIQLTAMPTEEETRKAEPVVKKMLAQERAALESGKKTRSEVAAAAIKLADETDTDAAKLLLMKGAFVLYVRDGKLEKAVETMKALKATIPDIPPQSVTNMIEAALLGVSKKEDGARLYKLLDDNKADISSHVESKLVASSVEERSSIASILKGMIKVPGRDYWLSTTELTQGQWESVMGYNLSSHKGKNLPVENVSRDDCDVFLVKLNQTKEVKASQFEFRLPELEEWKYAAWAGSAGHGSWIKPGVVGDVLDMAWVEANSSNQTHAVATKAPNAFGFYDMLGNVWEWLSGDAPGGGRGALKGCAFNQAADKCTWNANCYIRKTERNCSCGLRLAAHLRSTMRERQREELLQIQEELRRQREARRVDASAQGMSVAAKKLLICDFLLNKDFKRKAKYYLCLFSASWCGPCRAEMPRIAKTYAETLKNDPNIELIHFSRDQNDEKALAWAKEHDVKFPVVKPNGGNPLDLRARGIPHLFIVNADGTLVEEGHPKKLFTDEKLRELKLERGVSDMTYTDNSGCTWSYADNNEGSLTITGVSLQTQSSVTIPTSIKGKNVTRIGNDAFRDNAMITGVTIPGCIVGIGDRAFVGCTNLEELTILEGVKAIGGSDAFCRCPKLKSVTIPKSLTFIRQRAFKDMPDESMKVNVDSIEHWLSIEFGTGGSNPLCNGKSYLCIKGAPVVDLKIPDGTKELKSCAFFRYSALKSISIPGSVQRIGTLAFADMKGARIVFASNMGPVEIARDAFHNSSPDCRVEVAPKPGYVFAGWEDEQGKLVDDILNQKQRIVVTPRWAAEKMNDAFSLKAAPGSVTELDLGNVPPLQFVYCPAGKFSMGYKEQPALSKVKEIEITSPFWVSKTPIRVDQLASLGINSITDARIGAAGIDDASIVVQKLPSVLKERFGKMLPLGYVFRLPTEAEFEYLQKSETKDKDAPTNIWGVERLYSGGIIALLDRAPAYGKGVDVVNDASNGKVWTILAKVNYENQPDKDPVGWSDDPNWSVFRRRLTRDCKEGKLITDQRTNNLYGFYFVVAPDVDKLNKFYWK